MKFNILLPVPSTISSVINKPAMLAVMRETKLPETKARNATFAIDGLRSGASALSDPIMIPMELGLAKPQTAKVAIAADRSCDESFDEV